MIIELGDDIIRMWLEINQPTTKSIGQWYDRKVMQ